MVRRRNFITKIIILLVFLFYIFSITNISLAEEAEETVETDSEMSINNFWEIGWGFTNHGESQGRCC